MSFKKGRISGAIVALLVHVAIWTFLAWFKIIPKNIAVLEAKIGFFTILSVLTGFLLGPKIDSFRELDRGFQKASEESKTSFGPSRLKVRTKLKKALKKINSKLRSKFKTNMRYRIKS